MTPDRTQDGMFPVASSRTTRRRVLGLLGSERRSLISVVSLQLIATVAGLIGPQLLGSVVDDATRPGAGSRVDLVAAIFLGALVVQSVLIGLNSRLAGVLGERVLAHLREGFIHDVLGLPLGIVERAGTGDLLARASSDVEQLSYSVRRAAPEILVAAVSALLTIAALIWTAPVLGLALVPAVPLVVGGTKWYLRRAPGAYRREQAAYAKVNATIQESVAAGATIEAFRRGEERVATTDSAIERWIGIERETLALRTAFFPVTEAAYVIPLVLTVFLGGLLHLSGHLSIGAVTAAALYAQLLVAPVDVVLSWLDELQLGGASMARLIGVGDVEPSPITEKVPRDARIVADGLSFSYPAGHEVLRGIDLLLEPGSRLAVVGPSGAGKSTLALLLAGVHAPTSGSVRIGGVDAHLIPTERLRREIALVTQEHHVFSGTVRDNLALVAPEAPDDVLMAALDTVDAGDFVRDLPDGLATRVGSGGSRLSPAHAQQLALARLVLADPHTLVLDEATSLLDPRAARHLERSLARLLEGRTVVAVAHRLQAASDSDTVAVVESGAITEYGTHAELLAAGGAYARLWHSWQGSPDEPAPPQAASWTPSTSG